MLRLSLVMLVFVLVVTLISGGTIIVVFSFLKGPKMDNFITFFSMLMFMMGAITSIGVFEANAIQFDIDQLLTGSILCTTQLIRPLVLLGDTSWTTSGVFGCADWSVNFFCNYH